YRRPQVFTATDPDEECCRHGLAPPCCLPRRGPGAVLPHRDVRPGAPASRAGQGRLPALLRDRPVPSLGAGDRSGRRCLGWDERRGAARSQAPWWPAGRARRSLGLIHTSTPIPTPTPIDAISIDALGRPVPRACLFRGPIYARA